MMEKRKKRVKELMIMVCLMAGVLSTSACANKTKTPQEEPTGKVSEIQEFSVGYAKVEITPEESVPLAGYGNTSTRMSTGFLDRLYTHCTAITDEDGSTVLLFNNDLQRTSGDLAESVRRSISETTGISEDRIMISSSHTHSAPDTNSSEPSIRTYKESVVKWMTQAAEEALADRKPAEMYIGSVNIEGLNFVRHYELEDGTKVGYVSMITGHTAVAHVGTPDTTMQIVKFVREGGKDLLLTNWQVHNSYTGGAKKYNVSADFVGVFCTELGNALDCDVTYFQGAAGNVSYYSSIAEEEATMPESYREYGKKMVQAVLDAGDIYTKAETGKVQVTRTVYRAEVDHTQDSMLEDAQEVQKVWNKTNNRAQADAVGAPLGIRSPYHAGAIITRAALEMYSDLEMDAVAIGDVSFATACYEMFTQNGLYIKEQSPYKMTFIMGYANDHQGYMPAKEAFTYEGYERDTTKFVEGTAEELADTLLTMLNKLYQQK